MQITSTMNNKHMQIDQKRKSVMKRKSNEEIVPYLYTLNSPESQKVLEDINELKAKYDEVLETQSKEENTQTMSDTSPRLKTDVID